MAYDDSDLSAARQRRRLTAATDPVTAASSAVGDLRDTDSAETAQRTARARRPSSTTSSTTRPTASPAGTGWPSTSAGRSSCCWRRRRWATCCSGARLRRACAATRLEHAAGRRRRARPARRRRRADPAGRRGQPGARPGRGGRRAALRRERRPRRWPTRSARPRSARSRSAWCVGAGRGRSSTCPAGRPASPPRSACSCSSSADRAGRRAGRLRPDRPRARTSSAASPRVAVLGGAARHRQAGPPARSAASGRSPTRPVGAAPWPRCSRPALIALSMPLAAVAGVLIAASGDRPGRARPPGSSGPGWRSARRCSPAPARTAAGAGCSAPCWRSR